MDAESSPVFTGTEEALTRVLLKKPKAPKKPKAVKKPAKKAKPAKKKKAVKKSKPKAKAKKTAKKAVPAVERFERLDMRLSKTEKAKITAKAKKLRRTITSVVLEAIEKIK